MFPNVRKRACQWGTSNCTLLVHCRGTFENLINCKEQPCPFINLALPRLAILNFSFHVLLPHCSLRKQALAKPGSLLPSNWLSRQPYGPLIPLEALKYRLQTQGIMNIHRGVWLRCTPGPDSWGPLKGPASCRLRKQFSFCVLGWRAVQPEPTRDHTLCLCGRGSAKTNRLFWGRARELNSTCLNLSATHLPGHVKFHW